jgi:ATP/ADP translocase
MTAAVNLVGFVLQLFVTSRVIRRIGVRGALFVLPAIALVNYSIIFAAPVLAMVRIGKILENSTDYSIQNTLRQTLFLPTSRESKYKAKAAIDTFFTRVGDVVSAGAVALGQLTGFTIAAFASHLGYATFAGGRARPSVMRSLRDAGKPSRLRPAPKPGSRCGRECQAADAAVQ